MGEPVLQRERRDRVEILTLNRPQARNALSSELRRALSATFAELADDAAVGAVVLTGAGSAFCAGLDLRELSERGAPSAGSGEAVSGGDDMIRRIERYPNPVIGAVNGVAITGGFELALACDVLVGSPNARFADTHARVGILPGWGLSQKLPRWIGPGRAKLVSFTGNFVDAAEAERWGLLARVVPAEELLAHCVALANDMLSCEPGTLVGYKRLIDEGLATTYAEGRRIEAERSIAHAASVTAEQIAARRGAIQARGRSQTSGGR